MAFGGNFYAITPAADAGLVVDPARNAELIEAGLAVMAAINAADRPVHPGDARISGCHHVVFHEPGRDGADAVAATSIHPGWLDRSPCGTGTSARMAQLWARGELALDSRLRQPVGHRHPLHGPPGRGDLRGGRAGGHPGRSRAAPGSRRWASTCWTPRIRSRGVRPVLPGYALPERAHREPAWSGCLARRVPYPEADGPRAPRGERPYAPGLMPPRDDEVQALVEQLSADLDRSVLVDDASLRLLAYSPTLGSEDEVRKTAILTRETPRVIRDLHFAQGIASATQPVRTAPRPDIGLESRVCVPIRCQGALFGYLWLIDADQSLTDDDCAAAERTAAEIGTAMYRRDELEKPQRELEVRLLEMLLGDDAAARDAAAHELAAGDVLVAGSAIGVLAVRRTGGAGARARRRRARAARARAGPVPPHAPAPPRAQHGPGRTTACCSRR